MKQTCYIILLLLAAIMMVRPAAAKHNDTLDILWIGNSYTMYNDLPSMVNRIAAEQGVKLSATRFLKGGQTLAGHYANPLLIEALKKGGWDYVVIQEYSALPAQSTREVMGNTYHYAHLLDSLAHDGSPDVHVIYYMTWGHKKTNVHNKNMVDPLYPLDENYTDFQNRLKYSYIDLAYESRAWCAPVGMAWQTIRREHPEIELYMKDNYHPSLAGSYLAAHCFVATILQREYKSHLRFNLAPLHASILQETARRTVLDNKRLLGLMPPLIYKAK